MDNFNTFCVEHKHYQKTQWLKEDRCGQAASIYVTHVSRKERDGKSRREREFKIRETVNLAFI